MNAQSDHPLIQSPPPYTLITSNDAFVAIMDRLRQAPRLAIDTEADSLYHYFEKVCLLQISTDSETFIIDPLTVTQIELLAPLMADPAIEKVFHASGYDVFCLRRDYHFSFVNIFDTHLAGSLLGYEFLGLGAMMETVLGIYHAKGCQRDDWSHRPLQAEQLEYAAMDTHHLLRLRDALEAQLQQMKRLEWAREEFAVAAACERAEKGFDPEGFRRIKGFRTLSTEERLALRALYLFRDEAARQMDTPPFKVLNNPVLVDLAQRPPRQVAELFKRSGVSYRVARRFGDEIVALLKNAATHDPALLDLPPHPASHPPSRAARYRLELLKQWRLGKASELQLQVGVLFPANLLENLAATPPADMAELVNVPGMRKWRAQEFGPEVLRVLRYADGDTSCVISNF